VEDTANESTEFRDWDTEDEEVLEEEVIAGEEADEEQ